MASSTQMKKPSAWAFGAELKTMYVKSIAKVDEFVKRATYRPRHRRGINWTGTMHERGQLFFAILTGLMMGAAIFASFLD